MTRSSFRSPLTSHMQALVQVQPRAVSAHPTHPTPTNRLRHPALLLLALLLAVVSAVAPLAQRQVRVHAQEPTQMQEQAAVDLVYFPETGHHVSQPFLNAWDGLGGLATFGYPLSEQYTDAESGMQVQIFERARFEQHPEAAGTDAEVQFTLLGRWLAEQTQPLDPAFTPYPADTPPLDSPERHFFPETGHYLAYGFKAYWQQHGGLRIFGFPISEEFSEGGYTVQYFERARMEYHLENVGTPYAILLGRIGADRGVADGVDTTPAQRAPGVPDYDPALLHPAPQATSFTLPVLMYHQVTEPASRYVIPLWRLEQQLDWLQANGYTSVTTTQAYDAMEGHGTLPEKPVMLTFDDGFTSQWDAVQALNARGMVGVFFVTTGQPHLADWQLQEMAAAGHEIGAHTRSHPDLTTLSDAQLVDEIEGVRHELQAASGTNVDFFAYPFGAYDWRTIDFVQQAGFRGAVAAWGGSWWEPGRWWNEPRIEVDGTLSLEGFVNLLP